MLRFFTDHAVRDDFALSRASQQLAVPPPELVNADGEERLLAAALAERAVRAKKAAG